MASLRSIKIELPAGKNVYFASDLHLGAPNLNTSHEREKKFVRWLDEIKINAGAIFILGDLFDFWFEYKHVVPKGFIRTLAKLAEWVDDGIPVYFFTGNHDLWAKDYLEKEIGLIIYRERQIFEIGSHTFLLGHGDGLGPDDKGFKRMKKVFLNRKMQWLFSLLHPDLGVWLGNTLSKGNRVISGEEKIRHLGQEKEWLIQYSLKKLKEQHFDYSIFGHRHLPTEEEIAPEVIYINLGDWIDHFTYGIYDGETASLKFLDMSKV